MREKVVARKKLYKAKKSWVVAGLTTAFLMVNQASVSADQNVNDTSVTTTTQDVTTDQDTGIDASVTTTVSPNLDDTQVDNINIQA